MQFDLLDRLLALAGPQDAGELLLRLDQDLSRTSLDIQLAAGQNDRKSLCGALHVLLGVSGSIGADALYKLAEQAQGNAKSSAPLDQAGLANLVQSVADFRAELKRRQQPEEAKT